MTAEDAIETIIGRFGKYQSCILFLVIFARFPNEYQLGNVVFILPKIEYVCLDEDAYNLTNHCPCKNPQYDQSTIINSVTSTWDLICDRQPLASFAQSMLHVGILAGSLFYGYISDRYGRKLACSLTLFSNVVFVSLSAASTKLWMFFVFRFLIGTAGGGTMLCCYVIIMELSGKSFRPYLTTLIELAYSLSYITLPMIAYFIRDWRYLQLITSLPWAFVIFLYFILPESPRWLITTGQKDKAVETLTYIAKKNNRLTDNIKLIVEEAATECDGKKFGSYLDLFKTPNLRAYTFIVAWIWMCCSHTFFGVTQFVGQLQGNIYLNVLISSIGLVAGLILAGFASFYLKRRVAVSTSFFVTGFSLILLAIIPSNMRVLQIALVLFGFVGIYMSFILIYLFSSEIFPTVVRTSAMGFASVFARFGGFIAPFVVNIGKQWLSLTIFSIIAFCAGILCYFLPETKDIVLFNTIDQTEKTKKLETTS